VTPDRKQNLPIEIKLSRQIFSFLGNASPPPSAHTFVPGFRDLSFVDQNDR